MSCILHLRDIYLLSTISTLLSTDVVSHRITAIVIPGAETPVSVLGSILGSSLAESDPRDNAKGKTPVSTDPSKVRPS